VHALRGADFTLAAGEVHALLGENGAGKSTLMHIASGSFRPDAGTIAVRGHQVRLRSPHDSRRLGVGLVHQHFTAIPALSVAENIALAADWSIARPERLHARARELAGRTGLALDPQARTADLSVGARQRLEIVKALARDATILLLDEPTAVLAPSEAEDLLRRLRRFAGEGGSAVLITHKLDEALAVADRITVLRDGCTVLTGPAGGETAESLAAAMLGEAKPVAAWPAAARGGVLVSARELVLPREDRRGIALRGEALEILEGEVVGFAAVDGSGQRELLRAIAGLLRPSAGSLKVTEPVAFVPEDRTTEGLIPELSVAHNVALGFGPPGSWARGGRMDWEMIRQRAAVLATRFDIRGAHPRAPAGSLSGGNQQKLVMARALANDPRVIVAENPTRGLDVRAAGDVWGALHQAAAERAAVLVWSSDLDEIMAHSTRLLVVARGELYDVPAETDRASIGSMMLGGAAGTADL
jgi:simple sugar transport system ATP-binding protein